MVNILLVEDQVIVRKGLRMILEKDNNFSVVAEAGNGIDAVNLMEMYEVDVVLMDIRMPYRNGVETTKIIKQRWPDVKILVLTTFNDEEAAVQTLKDGANGFLLKTADPEKLIQAVHSCLEGGLVLNEEVAAKMMPRLLEYKKKEKDKLKSISLTERELEITRLVGEGKTNKEISAALYLSIGTVKNHITQILQQLDLRDRTQLAIYAVRNDLV